LSDDGRTIQTLTRFQTGETFPAWPGFLPGNEALLFNVVSNAPGIAVQRIGDGDHRNVIARRQADAPLFVVGHVIYAQTGNLMAVPFDLEQLKIPEALSRRRCSPACSTAPTTALQRVGVGIARLRSGRFLADCR
jgi:hypothetical protein